MRLRTFQVQGSQYLLVRGADTCSKLWCFTVGMASRQRGFMPAVSYKNKKKPIGRHTKPERASATAPLCTGADMCRTGVGAGSSAGADKEPDLRQSNHEWTEDQAGRRRQANIDSDGGSLVHAADDTPSKNAATRDTHCNFMR